MRKLNRFTGIAVLAIFVAPAAFGAPNAVTVGRFYSELGKIEGLGALEPAAVEAKLRSAGVQLPSLILDKNLSEGDLAAISNALGLSITTSNATGPVSETLMTQFLSGFGGQLKGAATLELISGAPTAGNGPRDLPPQADNGKGKKKGHNKSSSEPI